MLYEVITNSQQNIFLHRLFFRKMYLAIRKQIYHERYQYPGQLSMERLWRFWLQAATFRKWLLFLQDKSWYPAIYVGLSRAASGRPGQQLRYNYFFRYLLWNWLKQHVITSYSIHYTKLYERHHRIPLLRGSCWQRAGRESRPRRYGRLLQSVSQ